MRQSGHYNVILVLMFLHSVIGLV